MKTKTITWAVYGVLRTTTAGRAAKARYSYDVPETAHALEIELGQSAFTACGRRIYGPKEAPAKAKRCAACTKVIEESKVRKRTLGVVA